MTALAILLCAVVGVLLLPTLSDAVAIARLLLQPRDVTATARSRSSRFLFLVPAHNEEDLIASCVWSVQALAYPHESVRLVVIADNCSDGTASRAREAGAECLERFDGQRRGKPYAVAWGLDCLDLSPHDAVVILDADAVVDPGFATALDRMGPLRSKAVECYEDIRNATHTPLTRMARVFAHGRFEAAYPLKRAAGLNAPLGNGCCIGVDVLRIYPWQAFGLSEVSEAYASLTARGVRVDFARHARLFAEEAATRGQAAPQRSRWLSGRFAALRQEGPGLLASDHISLHQKLDALVELGCPGPALHLAVGTSAATLALAAGVPAAQSIATAAAVSLARPATYTLIGLSRDREPARAVFSFIHLPGYAAWRLWIAARTVATRGPGAWIRTSRVAQASAHTVSCDGPLSPRIERRASPAQPS